MKSRAAKAKNRSTCDFLVKIVDFSSIFDEFRRSRHPRRGIVDESVEKSSFRPLRWSIFRRKSRFSGRTLCGLVCVHSFIDGELFVIFKVFTEGSRIFENFRKIAGRGFVNRRRWNFSMKFSIYASDGSSRHKLPHSKGSVEGTDPSSLKRRDQRLRMLKFLNFEQKI